MIFAELEEGNRFILVGRESLGLLIKLEEPLRDGSGVIVRAVSESIGKAVVKINNETKVKVLS